jgi:hypothetical protein
MALTFGGLRDRRIQWRHELVPVIAVAGLFADYLSPAELWTILLPLGCVVLLGALRKWTAAAIVLVLSSWVAIPTAAIALTAIENSAGEHRLYAPADATSPLLRELSIDACSPGNLEVEILPIGAGQLINPRWVLRKNVETVIALHNAIVIDQAREAGLCPSVD